MSTTTAREYLDRNAAINRIRAALKTRSGKTWSVRGGRGTAYGWIDICSPPARMGEFGMTDAERDELSALLGCPCYGAGVQVAASNEYYWEYVDRAEGRTPAKIAEPYWD